jgi:hypothetical protein
VGVPDVSDRRNGPDTVQNCRYRPSNNEFRKRYDKGPTHPSTRTPRRWTYQSSLSLFSSSGAGIARRSPESPLPVHSPTVCFTSPVMSAAAAAAAAARCVPLRVSSLETAKSAASIPTSSAASASAPLRAAVAAGPGRRLPAPPFRCSSSSPENSAPRDLGLLLEVEG